MAEFHYGESAPAFVPDLPRDFRDGDGEVTKEVGCLQVTDDERYWNCIQVIELNDGGKEIRAGYYSESGSWQNKPMMLPPAAFSDLMDFAEGKVF